MLSGHVCTQVYVRLYFYPQTSRKELLYRKYVDLCAYVKLFVSYAHSRPW